ncbi:glycosyltransferase [Porticoccaceae bacterium]|nr:glycosyltransferase [Porticoccaceae bacterium]
MKKITVVSPFFFPELISTGKYNTDLAIQLSNQHLAVNVICSHPLYPNWKPRKTRQSLEGITINRGGGWLHYPDQPMLRRFLLEFWFFFFTLFNLRTLRSSDAVIVVLPPSSFVLTTFFLTSSTKIIGVVHDLQAVHLKVKGSQLKSFVLKLIKVIEKKVFRKCDSLVYLSKEMKAEAIHEYGLRETKCTVVYPSITIDDFSRRDRLAEYFDSECFNVVYSGALGEKQNPQGIFKIASLLVESAPNIRFIFFSGGPDFEKLRAQNISEKIIFNDLVDSESLGELLIRSDVQIVPQAAGTSKGSLPSKLPNILASGSMIFAITDADSELQELLSGQKGCFVSNTWDAKINVENLNVLSKHSEFKYDRSGDLGLYQRDYLAKFVKEMVERV